MLLYLRTSKGDINTQNTGGRVGELVGGDIHYNWAFPRSLEPYEIRKAQVEELGNDVGNMLLAVKVREDDDRETDIHIGIDGSFYQRSGQRVLDVSDINSIVASAVAKLTSTCPFPVGTAFLIAGNDKLNFFGQTNSGIDNAKAIAQLLQNQYSGTTWEMYEAKQTYTGIYGGTVYLYGIHRTA